MVNHSEQIQRVLDEHLPKNLRDPEEFELWYEPIRQAVELAAIQLYEEISDALEAERA